MKLDELDNRSLVTEYTKLVSKYERVRDAHPSILEIIQKYLNEILRRMKNDNLND